MRPDRVLITGAAGMIATAIRPFLSEAFRSVRLIDTRPVTALEAHEQSMVGDLHDPAFRRAALGGIDAIIHLTGIAANSSAEEHQHHNITLVERLIADARLARVTRVALASTMHVLGMYRRDERVGLHSPPRPDSAYAESKVAMERMAQAQAATEMIRICSVRIGCFKYHRQESEPCSWIGAEDLARLFCHVLCQPDFAAPVVHAVAPYWGDDCGQREMQTRLRFRFRHRGGVSWKDRMLLRRWYPTQQEARTYRGGVFAWASIHGVPIP